MPAAPAYDVVALRVEFQPDTTRFTTGDGTFAGLTWPLESRVDPLPHDDGYFKAHLQFLEHYVAAASDDQTIIRTHLIDEVVRVSEEMAHYSPHGMDADSDAERTRLAHLVQEAWQLAEAQVSFDVSQLDPGRTAFVIFHAGVGRDVELTGTALTKTPLDLPSLYFSETALASLGVTGIRFKGLPVTHTAVMPRTETRAGVNTISNSPILLELSINGLLAASFFNYLGVPDLFNTQTGESGIGPFGLMDPAGFFAYRGLFPPIPSAWTRAALGWVEPRELVVNEEFSLTAGEVGRVSVTESEYFLLENRVRNVNDEGLMLQIWRDGTASTQQFDAVTSGFSRFGVEDFAGGVVTGVNHYDWALPGWDADDNQFNGGLLIWHIDERRLAEGVNDNPDARAVDLEEADGAQDIGFDSNAGAPFDFYFAGNPTQVALPSGQTIRLYKNRFAHDTTPSSETTDGGDSFVVLEDFSAPGFTMAGRFSLESASRVTLNWEHDLGTTMAEGSSIQATSGAVSVYTGDSVVFASGDPLSIGARVRPVAEGRHLAVVDSMQSGYVYKVYEVASGTAQEIRSIPIPTTLEVRGPLVRTSDADYALFTDGTTSEVFRLTDSAERTVIDDGGLGLVAEGGSRLYFFGASGAGILNETPEWTYSTGAADEVGLPVMGQDFTGLWAVIPQSDGLLVLHSDRSTSWINIASYGLSAGQAGYAILADVNTDLVLDIVVASGDQVFAWSQNGALLPHFPLALEAPAASEPLVFRDSNGTTVLVASENGTVYGFDLNMGGRTAAGFPLSVGQRIAAAPLLQDSQLYVVSQTGRLRSYTLPDVQEIVWGQYRGSARNAGWSGLQVIPEPFDRLLVMSETYNWPNPVRNGQTFFRTMTTWPAEVTITIVDAAGTLIDELSFTSSADSPVEASWEAQVASGIYFARVMATRASGQRDSALIKLAVIR